jgi:hypothetical protein
MRPDGHNLETVARSEQHFIDDRFRQKKRDLAMPAMPAPPFPFRLLEVSNDAGSATFGAPRATPTEVCTSLKRFEDEESATRSSLRVS